SESVIDTIALEKRLGYNAFILSVKSVTQVSITSSIERTFQLPINASREGLVGSFGLSGPFSGPGSLQAANATTANTTIATLKNDAKNFFIARKFYVVDIFYSMLFDKQIYRCKYNTFLFTNAIHNTFFLHLNIKIYEPSPKPP
ncbi:MAG: hypothetical protein Q4D14_01850, partial [Bacteroidales bacterium]|nr:hypothetical protein [Bacteroidales bacterium]